MTKTYAPSETLIAVTCGECGVWFGMTEFMYEKRCEDQKTWHCPNGHVRHFIGKTEAEKQRERADRAESRLAATRDLLDHEQRSHAATRGHLTRTKKRVAHGVCPCCNRTFKQLAAHMKNKHPEYVEENATA